ncbi:MAG: triose-phosphate isomerase [Hyphomicrobiales bacterium]|nr:triose-phosphate isomerase [Hyphomicrobiales bacterium]
MTPGIQPLVAGNWKMNGLRASLSEIATMRAAVDAGRAGGAQTVVCPPATLLWGARDLLADGALKLGAQDCHPAESGPYTGDISAPMLRDAGALYVIVGHSERRAGHQESDALVRAKAEAATRAGLCAILCVGEPHAERAAGRAIEFVTGQLRGSLPSRATPNDLVVAYEPIWAIGSGRTATREDVAQMHAAIRDTLMQTYGAAGERLRILYGGSVKPANAGELLCLPNVDGALVGGASLKAEDFIAIAATYA